MDIYLRGGGWGWGKLNTAQLQLIQHCTGTNLELKL